MKKIQIIRNTVVKGLGGVDVGRKLTVGKDITERDAIYLVALGKAQEVEAKPAKTKKETAESKEASTGEKAVAGDEAEDENPLIVKAMELTGAGSFEELATFSDEELLAVNGIGEGMLNAIRKAME
jgi:hypothetical protein